MAIETINSYELLGYQILKENPNLSGTTDSWGAFIAFSVQEIHFALHRH